MKIELFLFLFPIKFIISALYECPKPKCGEITKEDVCIEPQENKVFIFQKCKDESKFCSLNSDYPSEEVACVSKTEKIHTKFDGMSCEVDTDCYSRKCQEGKCIGLKQDEECDRAEQCIYGLTCIDKKCVQPKKEGESCGTETDCEISTGCLNNVCTKYYSKKIGDSVGKTTETGIFSFCETGYADNNGICQSLKSETPGKECDENNLCKYTDSSGTTFTIEDNCKCGYNENGKRYCALGSGDQNYTLFIEEVKNYFFSPDSHCHIAEKEGIGCLKDYLEGDEEIKKKIKALYSSELWAIANYKMYGARKCVLEIMFPDYDSQGDEPDPPEPPTPGQPQCAKYSSVKKGEKCAASNYTSVSDISVTLSNICKSDEYCEIGGEPNIVFYQEGKNVKGECKVKDTIPAGSRYPGEACQTNVDCYKFQNLKGSLGMCENNLCTGAKKDEDCTSDVECVAGLYCDSNEKKCKEQISKGEKCSSSYECKNNLLCFDGKCEDKLYSVKTGEELKISEKEPLSLKDKFCEYGYFKDNKCAKLLYKEKPNSGKFVECSFGKDCVYTVDGTQEEVKKTCECGYNAEGKGYCPISHDHDGGKNWGKFYSISKELADNSCHTLSRFNCYKNNGSKKMDEYKYYYNTYVRSNLFHNSVSDAEVVLSGGFIKYSFLGVLILAFIL